MRDDRYGGRPAFQAPRQHKSEWDAFMESLPNQSWVREIVGQL